MLSAVDVVVVGLQLMVGRHGKLVAMHLRMSSRLWPWLILATATLVRTAIFPESFVVELCSYLSPWTWLWKETSNLMDRAMEVSSLLSTAWGHHLGAT